MNKNLFTIIEVALIGGLILVVLYWGGVFDIKPAPTPTVGPVIPTSTPSPTPELEITLATPIPTVLPTATPPKLVDPSGLIAFNTIERGNQEIFVLDVTASLQTNTVTTNITNNPADDYLLSWSPDGTRIAFFSTRTDWLELYVMSADGSNIIQLTNTKESQTAYSEPVSWSPDGTFLLAARRSPWNIQPVSNVTEIDRIHTDGSGIENVYGSNGLIKDVKLSPDGAYVAMLMQSAEGYGVHVAQLTESGLMKPNVLISCGTTFLWLPNTHDLTCHFGGSISIVKIGNTLCCQIVAPPQVSNAFLIDSAWSPDGNALIFEAGTYMQDSEYQNVTVSLRFLDGTSQLLSSKNDLLITSSPDWSWAPDSQWVAFTSDRFGQRDIFGINVYNPTAIHQFTSALGSPSFAPEWQP